MADESLMASETRKKAALTSRGKSKAGTPAKKTARKATKKAPKAKAAPTKTKKISRVPPDLEVDPDVLEFIEAIDRYKKKHNRPFPSWSEVLYVFRKLGYKKV